MTSSEALPYHPLTAISSPDGRYFKECEVFRPYSSELALIRTRAEVESRYLVALSQIGIVRPLTEQEHDGILAFGPNLSFENALAVKEIESTTNHDVKAVEILMREHFGQTSLADVIEMFHFALTSEDINNLSYRLMIDRARSDVLVPTLDNLVDAIGNQAHDHRSLVMIGRTHGQEAIPTTFGHEFAVFATRLNKEARKIASLPLTGKLGGAVGTLSAHRFAAPEIDWLEFSRQFTSSLGFEPNLVTTQINPYEDIIEIFDAIKRANGVVLDFDQDMWRYISDRWLVQKPKKGEVGSSVMTQKINPIYFENSEGTIVGKANGLLTSMGAALGASRLQRDLKDSTIIRDFGLPFAFSNLAYKNSLKGLSRVNVNPEQIKADLFADWATLGEPVQTLLRRNGYYDPYSLIANLTKGHPIKDEDQWKDFIDNLPIDDDIKNKLYDLTPENYIGYAPEITDLAIEEIRSLRQK